MYNAVTAQITEIKSNIMAPPPFGSSHQRRHLRSLTAPNDYTYIIPYNSETSNEKYYILC